MFLFIYSFYLFTTNKKVIVKYFLKLIKKVSPAPPQN